MSIHDETLLSLRRALCFSKKDDPILVSLRRGLVQDSADSIESLLGMKKILDDLSSCNVCHNQHCGFMPSLGENVRYNCPHYIGRPLTELDIVKTELTAEIQELKKKLNAVYGRSSAIWRPYQTLFDQVIIDGKLYKKEGYFYYE